MDAAAVLEKLAAFTGHRIIYKAVRMERYFLCAFKLFLPSRPRQTSDFGAALGKKGWLNGFVDESQEDEICPRVRMF